MRRFNSVSRQLLTYSTSGRRNRPGRRVVGAGGRSPWWEPGNQCPDGFGRPWRITDRRLQAAGIVALHAGCKSGPESRQPIGIQHPQLPDSGDPAGSAASLLQCGSRPPGRTKDCLPGEKYLAPPPSTTQPKAPSAIKQPRPAQSRMIAGTCAPSSGGAATLWGRRINESPRK